jgi:hypothetical protein
VSRWYRMCELSVSDGDEVIWSPSPRFRAWGFNETRLGKTEATIIVQAVMSLCTAGTPRSQSSMGSNARSPDSRPSNDRQSHETSKCRKAVARTAYTITLAEVWVARYTY